MSTAMPSLASQRRHLRRTAALTLLAWVLATMAGMVSACRLQTYPAGPGTPLVSQHADAADLGVLADQALDLAEGDHGTACVHEGQADVGVAGCLKFCNDSSSTVAKDGKVKPDLPVMTFVTSVAWEPTAPATAPVPWQSDERSDAQGPPLFIRFLRLTI